MHVILKIEIKFRHIKFRVYKSNEMNVCEFVDIELKLLCIFVDHSDNESIIFFLVPNLFEAYLIKFFILL